jgi:hypothetical protein
MISGYLWRKFRDLEFQIPRSGRSPPVGSTAADADVDADKSLIVWMFVGP